MSYGAKLLLGSNFDIYDSCCCLSLFITISSACSLLLSDRNMRWLHCSMTNVCKKNKEKLCRTAKSCKFKVFLLLMLLFYVCTWQSAFFHAPFSALSLSLSLSLAVSFFLASCLFLSPSKFGSTVCYRLPVVAFQTVSDTSWKEIEKGNGEGESVEVEVLRQSLESCT